MKAKNKLKAKKTVEVVVSSILASSMLASSCSTYTEQDVYKRYIPDGDIGNELLPISIRLKPEDAKYIKALQLLSQDILLNPEIAREVAEHPETILTKYGYDGKIDLDDSVTKIVMALGDDEINQAIRDKDINKFLSLCKRHSILSNTTHSNLLTDKFYHDQIEKIRKYAQTRSTRAGNLNSIEMEIFLAVGALVVVAVGVVVVVGFGAAWNVGGVWNNYVKINRVMNEPSEIMQRDLSVIDVIPLKLIDGYHLISEYYEDTVNVGVDFIREMHPDILKMYSEDEIKQLLYANIVRNADK